MDPTSRFRLLTSDPDWMLVDRYFSGECTPDEAKAIDAWASADSSHARLLASVRQVWLEAATPLPVIDETGAWRVLRERLRAAPPRRTMTLHLPVPRRSIVRSGWVIAASLVATTASMLAWRSHVAKARLAAASPREYVASRGQHSQVTLVDGTRVWLNAESRLRVPATYGAETRDVELTGEAYFIVEHDAHRTFRVHTPNDVLEDLGTEFDVRDYATDSATVVVVASGRVALRNPNHESDASVIGELHGGQMGTLDRMGAVQIVDPVDLNAQLGWMRGQLQFSERPLRDVARDLERWYDIDLAIDDTALLSVPVTASFTTQSADEALSILTATLGVHYSRDGRSVRIHRHGGHSH